MRKFFRNNKAFTLIEVITTITILSIVMAIAVGSIDSLVKNSKKKAMQSSAGNYVDAINLAIVQEEIETTHQILAGSIFQEYMKTTDFIDEYSDVLIEDGKLQQANFCFKDGIVTYSDNKYEIYLNDDCKQSIISDSVMHAFNLDSENKTEGAPVFAGINNTTNTKVSYEQSPYKLYMVSEGIDVAPTSNTNDNAFCDINSSNCDYRCIGGTVAYDEKGIITRKSNCTNTSAVATSAVNQGDLSLSWSLSLGNSLDAYFGLRRKRSEYRFTSRRYLDYITSSDGLDIGIKNPYLYKSFCDEYVYGNSEIVSEYCNNLQSGNRLLGTSSNYFKTNHIFLNGLYPYLQSDFSTSLTTTVSDTKGIKESAVLDIKNVKYDIKEYIKYGAVDFDSNNRDANIYQKISNIKKLLSTSSAVVIVTAYGENFEFYNKEQNIIYQPNNDNDAIVEQAMTVVGWDDNKVIDGKRGAWITITSNGNYRSEPETAITKGVNKHGFTYVSYYDFGYLSNEHYCFIEVDKIDNENTKIYSVYNSSYRHTEGSTSVRLKNVVGDAYATNIVFDRLDSSNYKEVINKIKIYNQFSAATIYKVYLRQREIYNEIGVVRFDHNEAGFKYVELNNSGNDLELIDDTIDIVITVNSEVDLDNLILLPEDFALFTTKTDIQETNKPEIKILEISELSSSTIHYVDFSILTNDIPTGAKIEFTATNWEGTDIVLGGASTTVVNDFAKASINFTVEGKVRIKVVYNDVVYKTLTVNASSNARPRCYFSQSKVTVYEDSTTSIKLTCKDDEGIKSRNMYATAVGPLAIQSYYAKVVGSALSPSKPSCSANACTWTIKIEGKRRKSDPIPLSLLSGAVKDNKGLSNDKITTYVTIK